MTTTTETPNLRTTRKEQAARRAPAKKAPAKAAPAKAAPTTTAAKLRWQFEDGYANRSVTGQTAACNGGELAMKPGENGWIATFTKSGKTTVLAEGVGAAKAYARCIEYSRTGK